MAESSPQAAKVKPKRGSEMTISQAETHARDNFDYISPLDTRYYGADAHVFTQLHPYLSEAANIRYQLLVEQAIVATLEQLQIAPRGISSRVWNAIQTITPEDVYNEEHKTHHNIRALVNCITARIPSGDKPFVHLFATSADIIDTARSLAFRDFTREVLLPNIRDLILQVIEVATQHADTPQIGRTHGRYAEPITVGYWLANFVMRLTQRAELLSTTAANLRGKYSGAVGVRSGLGLNLSESPSRVETLVLSRLGLETGDGGMSTQVIQPEYIADFGHALTSIFSVFANMADDFRHLMRSEIEELGEDLETYQVGSSTMPHKINPKNFENVKSLWKAFVPRMTTVYFDQISEHQRDLTNSASMRFFNELVAGVDYAARRLTDAIKKTDVNVKVIRENLKNSFSMTTAEPLYIALALSGNKDPYYTVRSLVLRARSLGKSLLDIEETRELLNAMPPEHQEIVRNPDKYIGDAVERTRAVCAEARGRLHDAELITPLKRPAENQTLICAA